MTQPRLKLKARTELSDHATKASPPDFDRALQKRPTAAHLLPDRGAKGNESPVFDAPEGSIAGKIVRQIRLLIVAPDSPTRHHMIEYLAQYNMNAAFPTNQEEALRKLALAKPDLILLDVRPNEANGLKLLCDVRSQSNVPLIVLGRHQPDEAERVIALELGADDCVSEPLGLRELVARIRAVLRRDEGRYLAPSDGRRRCRYRFAGWQFDRHTRRLTSPAGNPVALTKGEYALLTAFLDTPLRPLSRESLLQATRVHEDSFDRSIDVAVLRLRRTLKTDATAPPLIRTERGVGYALAVPVERL